MVIIFVFWNISFKVCNNACIMPKFGKNSFFINFLLSVFKMNDTFNIENDVFCTTLFVIEPEIYIQSL